MKTAYWIALGSIGAAIVAFYALSFRAPHSFAPASGKRSRWPRRAGLGIAFLFLVVLYVWVFRRLFL